MAFFEQAITVLQTLVIALGAGLGIWGVINLLEGAENMPGKWQLLIFLGQQTILNLQNQASA